VLEPCLHGAELGADEADVALLLAGLVQRHVLADEHADPDARACQMLLATS